MEIAMTQTAMRKVEPVAREAEEEALTERIIIPVSKTMEGEIKDYWHERRLNSKSEAVRHLIQAGLEAERKRKR
jgi:hypothetical protein